MKYKIFCLNSDKCFFIKQKIINQLAEHEQVDENYEYLFVIGGDGTLLQQLKSCYNLDIKVVHIKCGTNTFLGNEYSEDIASFSVSNKHLFNTFKLLKIKYKNQIKYAINEFYLQGELFLSSKIFIDENLLQTFRGFALLISTQIGSTALNKSIGAPIIFPSVNGWILNFLFSQNNLSTSSISNPIILSKNNSIKLKDISVPTNIYIDNEKFSETFPIDEISISLIDSFAKIFSMDDASYLKKMKFFFVNN